MTKFVVYEKVAEAAFRQFDKSTMSDGQQTLVNLGSGLMAGFAAAIVSQPADTMLSRMNKTKGLPGESTISRLAKIGGELGLRGSFSGIGARLFMVGGLTAGQFGMLINPTCIEQLANGLQPSTVTSRRHSVPPVVLRLRNRGRRVYY